ncbi:MAG TPA: ABC transporter ATP-binding protein [Acidimicrobiales bacterium]|nr:ABC transporter ATP-binding protein [Acidimicrobiales bacterium]
MSVKTDPPAADEPQVPGDREGESAKGQPNGEKRPAHVPPPAGMGRMAFGVPLQRSENSGQTLRRLASRLRPEAVRVVGVIILALGGVAFSVIGPKLLGDATDIIVKGLVHGGVRSINFGRLHHLLWVVVGLYALSAVLQYLSAYTLAGMVQRTMRRLRADVEDKLHRVPLGYVDRSARGDLLSRVTNDIDNLAQSLQQTISQLLTNTFMLVGTVVIMFVISPPLAVVALVSVPLSLWLIRLITRRSRPRFIDQWGQTGKLNALVEESLTGHAIVKSFGRQQEVEAAFRETNENLYRSSFAAQFISGSIQPGMVVVGNINYVAIAVIGGLRVAAKAMTIGGIQAFIQYSRQFAQPMQQLASMANLFQSGLASAERVFELLDAEEEAPDPPAVAFPQDGARRGRVEFEHVSFSYDPSRPLITDLSLVAEPGKTVAIVGPTGAGKTTLVNLIMRFYELDQGRITLDGQDIAKMPRQQLRSQIGMVLQDTWLFGGTIRDNIAYGNSDATEEQILAAAKATYVDRFVRALPDGYDTIVDDEGGVMSVGEKQLLTIARAFLANPTILILDEATSSVDTRTEVLIQHVMAALRSDRTSFVIAHRLSTIRNADTILVMEAGRIVEQGDHADLLARGGAYARLYNAQFAGAAADVT